ncbi:Plant invertase/pectin methylesterase inhibitor superfamily [Euphorbia peplus]|nr:Plant invertase/pectin methylesterase inhibitor superfamily [Euphorbia peplus]
MVFQDFDIISERRRLERQRKFRKRLTIAAVSIVVLLVIVGAGVFTIVRQTDQKLSSSSSSGSPSGNKESNSHKKAKTDDSAHIDSVIKLVCNSTDYKERCRSTLKTSVKAQSTSSAQPKDILKIAIQATHNESEKALKKAESFKFESKKEKAAFEDCKDLLKTAHSELETSVSNVNVETKQLVKNEADLQNWLSAVMSYYQTCIDGFGDEKVKPDVEKAFNATKELTSNALAMISGITELFASTDAKPKSGRRLLETESNPSTLDKDGFPGWISHEDRRMLKGKGKDADKPKPDAIVAKNGEKFKTITAALEAIPESHKGRYIIYVKEGVYDEQVTVSRANITMYGDGSQKSIITGNKNYKDGVQTFRTASFVALGEGFIAKAIGFRNTAGAVKEQAVALRVQADRAIFQNCRFEGYQDTLYVQAHRQYYRSCVISGTIDFIFGDAAAVFQNCLIQLRKPLKDQKNIITAQGRVDKHETTGIVLQTCKIKADKELKEKVKSYLGRPWKKYSRTIVMDSTIDDLIDPKGWLEWEGDFATDTLYYAEYNNQGPGANTKDRVKWPGFHVIAKDEANKYTVESFLQGGDWISESGAPVRLGLA